MILADTLASAFDGLTRNRMRSVLTTLGIIIGVGSVVLMVSLGASFEKYIEQQFEGIGANLIEVYPKGLEKFGQSTDTITFADAEAIERLSTVTEVSPNILVPYAVAYGGEELTPFILGSKPPIAANYGFEIDRGRFITDDDVKSARSVVVMGPDTAENLFDNADPLGKKVVIGGRKFTIIGINKEMGSLSGNDTDAMVIMPFTTAKSLTGQDYVSYVVLLAKDNVDLAIADIKSLLRSRHDIENPEDDPDKDDFLARSAEQATQIVGTVTSSLTAFLALVAGISLIVGGIGIMNIMLVSVTERTKEIGLRKAVGARRRDVLRQFLLEAVLLTCLGGLIGIVGGLGLAYMGALLANRFLGDFPFAISWVAIIAASLMAIGTGLAFGLYPARKAASLSPMEAIRYE